MPKSDAGETDASEQIARLREQVEALMQERIAPVLKESADRAEEMVREQTKVFAERVKQQPLLAIAIAAGIGFLIGRSLR